MVPACSCCNDRSERFWSFRWPLRELQRELECPACAWARAGTTSGAASRRAGRGSILLVRIGLCLEVGKGRGDRARRALLSRDASTGDDVRAIGSIGLNCGVWYVPSEV